MTTPSSEMFDYDIALSYAGEDRAYVEQIASALRQRDIRIFYDEYATAELWGNDLYTLLDEIYRKRARFTIIFVSQHYVSKPWTQHERQSAQARALNEIGPYLLPVRLDDSELPGLRPTVGYVDGRKIPPGQLVSLIEQKLAASPGVTTSPRPVLRCPRSSEEKRELLTQRPECWEFLLYAGMLWQGRQSLELKWRDHELGYTRRTGQYLEDRAAFQFVSQAKNDISACAPNLMKMLDSKARERAFGPPGQPGDPMLIEHLATRFIEAYEEILDTAARLRGTGVSNSMAPMMNAAAHLTDTPLREIRDFIDQIVTETDTLPDRLSRDEPITIRLTLILTVDGRAKKQLEKEINRARKRLRS